ncbi:unnamed protein product, partial [marine sediment metagenome]
DYKICAIDERLVNVEVYLTFVVETQLTAPTAITAEIGSFVGSTIVWDVVWVEGTSSPVMLELESEPDGVLLRWTLEGDPESSLELPSVDITITVSEEPLVLS